MRSVYAHKTVTRGDAGNLGDMMGFHLAGNPLALTATETQQPRVETTRWGRTA